MAWGKWISKFGLNQGKFVLIRMHNISSKLLQDAMLQTQRSTGLLDKVKIHKF
jgi:hypothetical protein